MRTRYYHVNSLIGMPKDRGNARLFLEIGTPLVEVEQPGLRDTVDGFVSVETTAYCVAVDFLLSAADIGELDANVERLLRALAGKAQYGVPNAFPFLRGKALKITPSWDEECDPVPDLAFAPQGEDLADLDEGQFGFIGQFVNLLRDPGFVSKIHHELSGRRNGQIACDAFDRATQEVLAHTYDSILNCIDANAIIRAIHSFDHVFGTAQDCGLLIGMEEDLSDEVVDDLLGRYGRG